MSDNPMRYYRKGSFRTIQICRDCDLVTEHTKCVKCGKKTDKIKYYKIQQN